MATPPSTRDKTAIIIEQTAFDTVEADAAAGIQLDCEALDIDLDSKVRDNFGESGNRFLVAEDLQTDGKGSMPVVNLNCPARNSLDQFLAGYFQDVTEGAPSPMDKTFIYGATVPDFKADAGFFFTIIDNAGAAISDKIKSAICKALTLTIPLDDMMRISSEWVGVGQAVASTPAGTYTREQDNKFHWHDMSRVTIDFGAGAQAVIPVGDIVFGFTQDVIGHDPAGGSFQNVVLTNRRGTLSIPIEKDANAMSAKVNAYGDTLITVNVGFGNVVPGTDEGDFDISATYKIEKVNDDNNDVLGSVIQGRLVGNPTIIFANGILRNW